MLPTLLVLQGQERKGGQEDRASPGLPKAGSRWEHNHGQCSSIQACSEVLARAWGQPRVPPGLCLPVPVPAPLTPLFEVPSWADKELLGKVSPMQLSHCNH